MRSRDRPELFDAMDLTPEVKDLLKQHIQRRLTPQAVKIRADIHVSCYAYEGIDAVKAALRAGLSVSTEQMPVKVRCRAAERS